MKAIRRWCLSVGLCTGLISASLAQAQENPSDPPKSAAANGVDEAAESNDGTPSKPATLKSDKLGDTRNVHTFGLTMLCGQPTAEEFAQAKQRGVQRVLNLREDGEIDWDEKKVVTDLGMEFYDFGFRSPDSLTDEMLDKARKVLAEKDRKPVMMHCGSANRVGAVWAAHRALDGGLSVEEAIQEAKQVGLRSAELQQRVIEYIRTRQAEPARPKAAADQ